MPKKITSKHRVHTRYFSRAGRRLPGVTTVTGKQLGWNTDVLGRWNNRMGLQGVDTTKYVDDKAQIGTLGHLFITDFLQEQDTDTSDYSQNQIVDAKKSFNKFMTWYEKHTCKVIFVEKPMVSERYLYGGTLDIFWEVDGYLELTDLKTGSGVYDEMIVQVAAYYQLLLEHGYKVQKARILNVPRSDTEAFLDPEITSMIGLGWSIFRRARENHADYNALKRARGYS
jgi:hypothetical protein